MRLEPRAEKNGALVFKLEERSDKTDRRRDANCGGAANGERGDGVAHFVERLQVALDEFRRQPALVNDAQRPAIWGPLDCTDRFHGGKLTD